MKKTILALAVLGTVAGTASAQSGLTLSGQVDFGVARVDDAWNVRGAGSGRNNISFSGREDLGNGMAAGFYLNHRFDLGNGANNSLPTFPGANQFWRQGWVQLDTAFGDLRLGRMLPPLQQFNGGYEPWAGGDTVASIHAGGRESGAVEARYSNAIYYRTPSFGGLKVHAMVAAAEDQGALTSPERPIGLGVEYAGGPFSAALAYERNDEDIKALGVYAKYNFGVATLMGQFETSETSTTNTTKMKRYSIGATAPLGAAVLKVGVANWKEEEKKKFGVGIDYNLSKRTFLYTDIAKQSGDGFTAVEKKVRFDVGISHKF